MVDSVVEHFHERIGDDAPRFAVDVKVKVVDDATPDLVLCRAKQGELALPGWIALTCKGRRANSFDESAPGYRCPHGGKIE
jgi:hypothetical protein